MKQKIQKMSSKSYIVDMYVHSTTYENCIRRKNTTLALRVEEGRPQKGLLEDRGLLCVWQGEMHQFEESGENVFKRQCPEMVRPFHPIQDEEF